MREDGAAFAVSNADAKKACELSGALKGSASTVGAKALAATETVREVVLRVAALRARLAALEQGDEAGGAWQGDEKRRAMQALRIKLQDIEGTVGAARQAANEAVGNGTAYALSAGRLAGHIDGLVAMLATWYAGKNTHTNNAMCISKKAGSQVEKWPTARLNPGAARNNEGDLKGCFEAEPSAKGTTVSTVREKAHEVTDLVGTFNRNAAVTAPADSPDSTCPFLTAHNTGSHLWHAAEGRPYVKLGGLSALSAGGGGTTKIGFDASEPKDYAAHVPDANPQHKADDHKAVKDAVALGTASETSASDAVRKQGQKKGSLSTAIKIQQDNNTQTKTLEQWLAALEADSYSSGRPNATEENRAHGEQHAGTSAATHEAKSSRGKTSETSQKGTATTTNNRDDTARDKAAGGIALAIATTHAAWAHALEAE
ncbi:hypothetical protein TRVL_06145 [Trypanosoma vivax]|nr:hypothetical protein TRVL_06145 [Trypanosoma vivax]